MADQPEIESAFDEPKELAGSDDTVEGPATEDSHNKKVVEQDSGDQDGDGQEETKGKVKSTALGVDSAENRTQGSS